MNRICFFLVLILMWTITDSIFAQETDNQIRIEGRINSPEQIQKPYLILISADGFRHDYFEKYKPEFLLNMKNKGVWAEYMAPSFPSSTFPNHYTLVTGMVPAHHGVVGNSMYDRETGERFSLRNKKAVTDAKWYGGIPLWSLAESQNLLTACFFWPGSEAPINGYYPTYYYPYSEDKTIEDRISRVVDWLQLPEEERPHFITFYFPDIDHAGHEFGPDTAETEAAVKFVDNSVKALVEAVQKTELPVNFIFLSDHGMTSIDTENPLRLPKINPELMEVSSSGTYVGIYVKDKSKTEEEFAYFEKNTSPHYKVYLKEDIPEKYVFSAKHDFHNRIGDIVLIAEAPYYFTNNIPRPGGHGYHPDDCPDMNTIFMAWGPDILESKKIEPFQNTHVFPLMAELLQLEYNHSIDGDKRLIPLILKPTDSE